ncbi:MAG: class I SAM-dependent methyltransferase [Bacteroidetes bacterium]|nr:MAG: class I SAM-dependent methyltransferase [Bacteroidota bacterium]
MQRPRWIGNGWLVRGLLLVLLTAPAGPACRPADAPTTPAGVYTFGSRSEDGTGKYYMGREIAQVMGHRGVSWLERPSREAEEFPDRVVRAMALSPADVVADIGAGTGYFTFRIAERVPHGLVYAVDIQDEMLDIIRERIAERGLTNIVPVRGTETDPNLPRASLDVALMVDAYHEFSFPHEMMTRIVEALKPGGLVVLVEYRGEDPTVPIKPLHKMTVAQARREMEAVGLVWRTTKDFLPQQHFMVFEKPIPEE